MSCWSNIEGTWSYNDLIGSKFKVKSVRIANYGLINKTASFRYSNEVFTLKAVYFRSSTDGKVITLFRMEEVCGKLFLPRDLELVEICKANENPSICGEFKVCPKSIIIAEDDELSGIEGETTTTTSTTEIPGEGLITTTTTTIIPGDSGEGSEEIIDQFEINIDSWEILIL